MTPHVPVVASLLTTRLWSHGDLLFEPIHTNLNGFVNFQLVFHCIRHYKRWPFQDSNNPFHGVFSVKNGAVTLKTEKKEKHMGYLETILFSWTIGGGEGSEVLEHHSATFPRRKSPDPF